MAIKKEHSRKGNRVLTKEKPLTQEGFLKALNKIIKAKKPDEKRSDKGTKGTSA